MATIDITSVDARPHAVLAKEIADGHASIAAGNSNALPYHQDIFWYLHQKLDHFDRTNTREWNQRFFVVDDYWKAPKGPIIYNLCGEYTCPGVNPARLWILELAQQYGAKIVSVEHRFYGDSQPTHDQATGNLRWLTSQQALADFARLQSVYQRDLNTKYNKTGTNKWFTIGGSYPGALSSWYRQKYPHLTVGSLASSGVVFPYLLMPQFDQQVGQSAGPDCTAALRATTADIEAKLSYIKPAFKASALSDGDFFWLVADAAAESVQYGHRKALCQAVLSAPSNLRAEAFANFTVTFFYGVMGNSADDYNMALLVSPTSGNARSWWWQTCTEVGWWQIAPAAGSIRSLRVDQAWHQGVCEQLFGLTTPPETNATNLYYGAHHIVSSNIYFTNGVEDPWKWATIMAPIGPSLPATIIDCEECGHCVELYTPTANDAPVLVQTRIAIRK